MRARLSGPSREFEIVHLTCHNCIGVDWAQKLSLTPSCAPCYYLILEVPLLLPPHLLVRARKDVGVYTVVQFCLLERDL